VNDEDSHCLTGADSCSNTLVCYWRRALLKTKHYSSIVLRLPIDGLKPSMEER